MKYNNLKFKKKHIAIGLSAIISYPAFSQIDDGSHLLNDPNMNIIEINNDTAEALLGVFGSFAYLKEQPQTNNNVVILDYSDISMAQIIGGHFSNSSLTPTSKFDLLNTHVIINQGSVSQAMGASYQDNYLNPSANSAASVQGSVYNNGGTVMDRLIGAEIFTINSKNNVIGTVYHNSGTTTMAIGAITMSSTGTEFAEGSVYHNGGVIDDIVGVERVKGTQSTYSDLTGKIYITNGTTNNSVIGISAELEQQNYANVDFKLNSIIDINTGLVYGDIVGNNTPSDEYTIPYTIKSQANISIMDSTLAGNIYGIKAEGLTAGSLEATSNISLLNSITQNNTNNTAEIWGAYLTATTPYNRYYQIFNNNTLTMGSNALTFSKMGNFEHYNFYLNEYNQSDIFNQKALLTITNELANDNTFIDDGAGGVITTANQSNVKVAGISGENIVQKGDSIVLIDASTANLYQKDSNSLSNNTVLMDELFNLPANNTVKVGLVGEARINYTIDSNNQTIIANIEDIKINKDAVDQNSTSLAAGQLIKLQDVNRGSDLLIDTLAISAQEVGDFAPIAIIDGGSNRYKTGSSIDSTGYRFMVGSRYQATKNTQFGLALEYGRSDYDSYNDFDFTSIHGKGHTYHYGLSLFAKSTYDLNIGNIYTDYSVRLGRTKTAFNSNDIITGAGTSASYNNKNSYWGAHIGLGYIYPLDEKSSFDTSIRYLYTRIGSNDIVVDGDRLDFKKAQSSRIQLKEQYNYKFDNSLGFYLAGTYEHEFDSEEKITVANIQAKSPTLKGGTGIMELGINITPIEKVQDLSFKLSLKGYTGKREGVNTSLFMQYNF